MAAFTALALGLLAAGTTAKVVGDIKAGNAAEREGAAQQQVQESEAQLADYNASIADQQARDSIERGADEEARFRTSVRGMIGSQRAGFAAGNIDVSYGSAVDVQADAAFLGELDSLTIRTNAAREAWGYKVNATDLRQQADIARKGGRAALEAGRVRKSASRWGAASTLLGGGTSLLQARYGLDMARGK